MPFNTPLQPIQLPQSNDGTPASPLAGGAAVEPNSSPGTCATWLAARSVDTVPKTAAAAAAGNDSVPALKEAAARQHAHRLAVQTPTSAALTSHKTQYAGTPEFRGVPPTPAAAAAAASHYRQYYGWGAGPHTPAAGAAAGRSAWGSRLGPNHPPLTPAAGTAAGHAHMQAGWSHGFGNSVPQTPAAGKCTAAPAHHISWGPDSNEPNFGGNSPHLPGFEQAPATPASAAAAAAAGHSSQWGGGGGPRGVPDTGADQYTGYRLVYKLDRFTASYRTLVVFYMAMFIACYAQEVNTPVFWGTWCALVLMYWEPFLAPPYPWLSGYAGREECFSRVEQWGSRPAWLKPADAAERAAIRQWLFAVRRGLNQKQMQAYKFLAGLIIFPCGSLWAGAVTHIVGEPLQDVRAVYSSCILLFLLTTYTLATTASLVLHDWLIVPRLRQLEEAEIEWRTHDMMFFTCKILGETLNTTVQTLVAGAFVSYMPTTIFWLSILITALSYTATNLLYGMDQGDGSGTSSRYGGRSAFSTPLGTSAGAVGAFPSTFGNMLFQHASHVVAQVGSQRPGFSVAQVRASEETQVSSSLRPSVSIAEPGAVGSKSQSESVCPAGQEKPVAAGFYAWASEDGSSPPYSMHSSTAGVLPFAAASTPKVQQYLVQEAPWEDLASPQDPTGVLHITPDPHSEQQQQQQQQLAAADTAAAPVDAVTAATESKTAAAVAGPKKHVTLQIPVSAGGSVDTEEMLPSALPPQPPQMRPQQQQQQLLQHKCLMDGACWVVSEDGSWVEANQEGAAPAPAAAAAPTTPATLDTVWANITLCANTLESQQQPTEQQQQQQQQQRQPRKVHQVHGGALRKRRKEKKPKAPPSPPFLTYKAPRGWRDWCIVGLLITVAAPSVAILFLVSWGVHTGDTGLYFEDPSGGCMGPCEQRYREMLILLCSLGLLICYYAFTVGFLQAGPVTWIYRRMAAATVASAERMTEFGAQLRTTFAGGHQTSVTAATPASLAQ